MKSVEKSNISRLAFMARELARSYPQEAPSDFIFGIQGLESSEQIGFVSLTLGLNRRPLVAYYSGEEGPSFHRYLLNGGLNLGDKEISPYQNCLAMHFCEEDELLYGEWVRLCDGGFQRQNTHLYPVFRAYRPFFAPMRVTAKEASILETVISHTKEILERINAGEELRSPTNGLYLVRQGDPSLAEDVWNNICVRPFRAYIPRPFQGDVAKLSSLKNLEVRDENWELDFAISQTICFTDDDRPFHPFMCVIVNHLSGEVLGIKSVRTFAEWPEFVELLETTVATLGYKPQALQVHRREVAEYFGQYLRQARIDMLHISRLDYADQILSQL